MTVRYFDNAATSFPKPPGVAEAMLTHLQSNGAPGRGMYGRARETAAKIRRCRHRIATLVGLSSPEHVVFGYNTTDALNLGLKGVLNHVRRTRGPDAKLHVVITQMEHNSILRPLHAMCELDANLSSTMVTPDPITGLIDPALIADAIRPGETVLVCINHASNVTGSVQDLRGISAAMSERRLDTPGDRDRPLVLVDGAQSLGHIDVNMPQMGIDLLAFAGHKGLLGPTGTGGLCIRPGVEHVLDTIREGGTGNVSELQTHPQMLPEKYEPGSHNAVGILGLSEGVAWLLERGVSKIREHECALSQRFMDALGIDDAGRSSNLPGLRLLGMAPIEKRLGVFSIVHDELSPAELSAILESPFGVLSRPGLHCAPLAHEAMGTGAASINGAGACRLSIGPFHTREDIDHVVMALRSICEQHLVSGQKPAMSNPRTLRDV